MCVILNGYFLLKFSSFGLFGDRAMAFNLFFVGAGMLFYKVFAEQGMTQEVQAKVE